MLTQRSFINIRNISKFILILPIITMIIYLMSCERIPQVTEPTTSDMGFDVVLKIGLVLPLTGRHVLTIGKPVQQALELARNEINNSQRITAQLEFIVVDNQSTVEGSVEAYNKLIVDKGVSVILGPATSSATKGAFPIAGENQVVAISPISAARGLSAISDYTFRVALATDVLMPNGVEATHVKLGYQKIATMYDESDVFSTDSDKALRETLTAREVNILSTEHSKVVIQISQNN